MRPIILSLGLWLLASTIIAQEGLPPEQREVGQRRTSINSRSRIVSNRKWFQLRLEPVQVELGLNKEVIEEIEKLFEEQSQVNRELQDDARANSEIREKIVDDCIAKINGLLTPAQQKRLQEIHLQSLGADALLDEEVRDQLKLSSDQITKIGRDTRGTGWRRDSPGTSRDADYARAVDVLDAEQKELFKTILGKPFSRTRSAGRVVAGDEFNPRLFEVSAGELREAIGLDVYKYITFMRKDEKFNLVLREFAAKNATPVELMRESFTPTRDDDIEILVCFRKLNGALGSALLSSEEQLEYEVTCRSCGPYKTIATANTPLAKVPAKTLWTHPSKSSRPDQATGTVLLFIKPKDADAMFPYAELVIEKVKQ